MIPTNPSAIKKMQEQADRNIARGDWEDEFGLPDASVPKESGATNPAKALVEAVGRVRLPKRKK